MSKRSYKALEKERIALKINAIGSSKELIYKKFFDDMADMVDVIELIYDKNGQPIDFYIRVINIAFANFFGKTQEQLINKKISSIVDVIEDHWLASFASVDKTGEEIRFKSYGAAYDKFYHVTAWKFSENRVGVSMTDITETEKAKSKLRKNLEKEKKVRTKTEGLLKEKRVELQKTIYNLNSANEELSSQNVLKDKRTNELAAVKVELEQQNSCLNKAAIVSETDADFNIIFVNDNFCELYGYHREELIGKNHRILKSGKQPDAFFTDMISTIRSGKLFKGKVLNKKKGGQLYWMDITIMPFKDLNGKIIKHVAIMFDVNSQTAQKEALLKQADELAIANTELAVQNKDKDNRADDLFLANKEKQKRADELAIANKELAFQNDEKQKRADELAIANKELAFQNSEKQKRADELAIANKELAFQNDEKQKRADELAIANKELTFQNDEKQKRADELAIANTELAFQNKEKDNRADELILANKEKGKRADELVLANKEKEKRANELILANKELAFQTELDIYRSEMEHVAHDLTLLIDTANAPIFGIDNKGLVNEWNQTSESITGFTKKEVLGKDLVQTYITEDYRESVKKVLDDALLGKETANYEFPLFAKDGQRVMVLLNSSTRRDAKGKITGVLGVGQDISEIDTLRTASESIAKELRQFIETANAPIFGIDSKGLVNEWNQTSESITGFTKDEVLGKDLVNTYITEDYRESVKKVLDDALLGKETANYEFPLFTKDGQRVMVLLNSSTRRDANGKITGVLGVGQDISEIDKLRTESEYIAKELRQFIETANAPIFGIDSKGLVNEWNQTSEKITGFTKAEVLGKDLVRNYITEDYRESVKKVLDDALLGEETANYEFPLFTKDGQRVMVLLNSSTRRDTNGEITGVLGVGQDISEIDTLRTASESIAKELRQFIETANAPIFGIDSKGLVNEWNQTSESITGFTKDEVLGKDLVSTYITEDYRESVKKVLDDALLGTETANYEFPLFTKDGQRVMVLLNSSTRRDANGKITGVLGVGQDISEIDKLRTESEYIAKELRQFIETANAPIFGIDSKGLVNEWNQTSEKITGFTKAEVLGKDLVRNYITEDYRKSVKKVLDDALLGEETANYEFPLFTKDGQRVMVLLNSSTRRDTNGKITGVLGVGQDISEIDTLRTASESIAKELRQFIETANAPIFGIDSKGLVNEWNQTSESITGFTKSEVLSKDLVNTYITEDYRESVKKVLDDALLGQETANYEFPLFTKDGQRVMVLLNSSTRRDINGEIIGVLGVGQDITELAGYRNALELKVNERTLKLNQALEKQKELNQLKSRFVSTASHEFRTPLSSINFAAGSIKKYWAKMEPIMIQKKLDKIEDQVLHMTKLLDDVLIVGKAEAGKIIKTPVNIIIGDFINEIIDEISSACKKSHKIVLIDTESLKGTDIFIDEKLGRNIFINIIGNAVKYSPNAKIITIALSSENEYTVVTVTDYGIGISKSELKNIFKPFSRGKNVDLIQGTGLGLTIAKDAIDVIGGKIIVKSAIGKGTSFIVKILKKQHV